MKFKNRKSASILAICFLMLFVLNNILGCNNEKTDYSYSDSLIESSSENKTETDKSSENSEQDNFSETIQDSSEISEISISPSVTSSPTVVPTLSPTMSPSITNTPENTPSIKPPRNLNYDGLGFNYWPGGYGCDVLWERNWSDKNKEIIRSDLNMMASIGTKVIRLMFWPQLSGWVISENQGGTFNSSFDATIKNLPELIEMISEFDMKVIIAYGNNYLDLKNAQGINWWRWAYGDDGFQRFLDDTIRWSGAIAKEIEKPGISEHILYYDYQNEIYYQTEQLWTYVRWMYDNLTVIKSGKRGISTLFASGDPEHLADALNLGKKRTLDYIEFHSYPGHNQDISVSYDNMKSIFPNSEILLGEFGCSSVLTSEQIQKETVESFMNQAKEKGISNYIHWMFVDQAPNADNQRFGLINYDRNPLRRKPKEALKVFTKGNIIRADFSTDKFNIKGNEKLYINFFYRNMSHEIYFEVKYFDGSGNLLKRVESGKGSSSELWTSISYQLENSKGFDIPAGAENASIKILSNGDMSNAEVDYLSFYTR